MRAEEPTLRRRSDADDPHDPCIRSRPVRVSSVNSMIDRRLSKLLGALLISLALILALLPLLRPGRPADATADAAVQDAAKKLQIDASVSPRSLRLRFTRPNGAAGDLELVRDRDDGPWVPDAQVDAPGIMLGDGYPVFATPRFLAVHGIDPRTVLKPMSVELLDEVADEVTILRGWGGEIAVCLWRHDKVVCAYLSGPVFDALRRTGADQSACARLESVAAGTGASALRTAASAAALAGCAGCREAALDRLRADCDAGEDTACDLMVARAGSTSELWPEVDDLWRWVLDVLDASAVIQATRPAGAE